MFQQTFILPALHMPCGNPTIDGYCQVMIEDELMRFFEMSMDEDSYYEWFDCKSTAKTVFSMSQTDTFDNESIIWDMDEEDEEGNPDAWVKEYRTNGEQMMSQLFMSMLNVNCYLHNFFNRIMFPSTGLRTRIIDYNIIPYPDRTLITLKGEHYPYVPV